MKIKAIILPVHHAGILLYTIKFIAIILMISIKIVSAISLHQHSVIPSDSTGLKPEKRELKSTDLRTHNNMVVDAASAAFQVEPEIEQPLELENWLINNSNFENACLLPEQE